MPADRRVIGSEHVERASRRGRRHIEVLPGTIVTAEARDSAARLRIALRAGPLDRPAVPVPDGTAALVRGLYRRGAKWMPPARPEGRNPVRFDRLAVVGAGGVGANVAHLAANAGMADEVVVVDIVPGLAESLAVDLAHASGLTRSRSRVTGGTGLGLVAGADVAVVTAGRPRAPGMDRADLLEANRRTVRSVAESIRTASPGAVVLVVSNPLDEMTVEMLRATEFPRERVLGMAGTLDSARFREALARTAGVEVDEVEAMVLGSHGAEMVPVVSRARIRGAPLERHLRRAQIDACVERTVAAGARVVALRKTGSATLAPAHAVVEVLEHLRGARAGAVPVSVRLDGEFGIEGVVLGVPCRLGPRGLIEIEEIPLAQAERSALSRAAAAIRSRIDGAERPVGAS
ncbi:MAG: malate dehydrogenase [Immundisolibacterales bacterium]|nr:malate dehydrogenase [Immundisolibacterales bacterium]